MSLNIHPILEYATELLLIQHFKQCKDKIVYGIVYTYTIKKINKEFLSFSYSLQF